MADAVFRTGLIILGCLGFLSGAFLAACNMSQPARNQTRLKIARQGARGHIPEGLLTGLFGMGVGLRTVAEGLSNDVLKWAASLAIFAVAGWAVAVYLGSGRRSQAGDATTEDGP